MNPERLGLVGAAVVIAVTTVATATWANEAPPSLTENPATPALGRGERPCRLGAPAGLPAPNQGAELRVGALTNRGACGRPPDDAAHRCRCDGAVRGALVGAGLLTVFWYLRRVALLRWE